MSIRTVLGDIQANQLGPLNYHEHLFQVSPLLPGDELDDERISTAEAASLRRAGMTAMIEATPLGLGRDPSGMQRVSSNSGLTVIATTGCHRSEHYRGSPQEWVLDLTVDQLEQAFVADVSKGIIEPAAPEQIERTDQAQGEARAGVLKVGIGYWSIDDFASRVLEALSRAHLRTRAPVMVHLEHGSMAFEVLEHLQAWGVAADSVVLAHIDRNPDPGLHAELAAEGAYLGYDGAARHREYPDSVILQCLVDAAAAGAGQRILLGGDVARRTRYKAAGGHPGLEYLPLRFVPRLRQLAGDELVNEILVANPRALLDRDYPDS
jgi:phosphotriesterase-related protein